MHTVPHQCKLCSNFNIEDSLCSIHEQLPGEYGRESVKDCPSFLERGSKQEDDMKLLVKYLDEDPESKVEESIRKSVDRILSNYESKYKILVVGIARRKIKSIIKMVDIVDKVLDRLGEQETITQMQPSQSIRLLSELNHSINNDLTFIMKLVNPDTKLGDLQMWIDNSSISINGTTPFTDMKVDEIINMSGPSRDKVREAFDTLLRKIETKDESESIEVSSEVHVDE